MNQKLLSERARQGGPWLDQSRLCFRFLIRPTPASSSSLVVQSATSWEPSTMDFSAPEALVGFPRTPQSECESQMIYEREDRLGRLEKSVNPE